MAASLINAPCSPRRACLLPRVETIISSPHPGRADEVQVAVLRREINKLRNTDWNVQIPGERRQLALAGGRVGVSLSCRAHDDSAPGGAALQTSGEKAETLAHARRRRAQVKGQ